MNATLIKEIEKSNLSNSKKRLSGATNLEMDMILKEVEEDDPGGISFQNSCIEGIHW